MIPLSKAKLKFFRSLLEKKYRHQESMFWVEGIKMYEEALNSKWEIAAIVVLETMQEKILPLINTENFPIHIAEKADFKELTGMINPEGILTLLHFPKQENFGEMQENIPAEIWEKGNGFVLENIQDPGNVGTILRIADWFGMEYVLCTEGTADVLNPKTLRASMGAIFRVKVLYAKEIVDEVKQFSKKIIVADMQGANISQHPYPQTQWILMGNEANGISQKIREINDIQIVTIEKKGGAESLNVSVAAGILAYSIKSQT